MKTKKAVLLLKKKLCPNWPPYGRYYRYAVSTGRSSQHVASTGMYFQHVPVLAGIPSFFNPLFDVSLPRIIVRDSKKGLISYQHNYVITQWAAIILKQKKIVWILSKTG